MIEKNQIPLVRAYLSGSHTEENLQQVMKKIESDALASETGSFFFSKEISSLESYSSQELLVTTEETENWTFITIQQKTQTITEEIKDSYFYNVTNLLCKNDPDEERSYGEYDFSARKDTEGNTSARGEIDYTWQSDRGSSFSVGVGGEVNRNDRNGTSGKVEINATGIF